MATQVEPTDEGINGINVTPLVDITLVLLIVFMVTAKLIAGQGIPLDLPKAATAGTTQTMLSIAVDAGGKVRANGEPLTSDEALRNRAKQALRENPDLRTVIAASSATSHGDVMRVVDTVREAGIAKIAFAAQKKTTDAR